jgi:hypothetical protein
MILSAKIMLPKVSPILKLGRRLAFQIPYDHPRLLVRLTGGMYTAPWPGKGCSSLQRQ